MTVQKPTLDEVFLSLTGHGADDQAANDQPSTDDLTLEVTR
jgi:hypothetical protein